MRSRLAIYVTPILVLVMISMEQNVVSASEPKKEKLLWEAIKSGTAFALIRHALAPGTGDPEDFTLGVCNTQRNLSVEGRRQAATIGKRFRTQGIKEAKVFSSQWCRCRETAALLMLGKVGTLREINSFFETPDKAVSQTKTLKIWLNSYRGSPPLILVTHQVNITALTGVFPNSGEIVVVQWQSNGQLYVMGSL